MIRVVQVESGARRRVALVDEPRLRVLDYESVYALACAAIQRQASIGAAAIDATTSEVLDYDEVYEGRSPWRLLPPIHHPSEPARCIVSGTGLTHVGSAKDRHKMHDARREAPTDSIRMFQEGLAGGRPAAGRIGVAPEWFYKGNGTILRAHGDPLVVPPYAEDGGEEAEVAGVYVIDEQGRPRRVGMAIGNEFSDHRLERRNYLNLAASKLRTCSLGPELAFSPEFTSVPGEVWIERAGERLWSREIATGEAEMSHSLRNLEHHHFKFELHRRPMDVHVHFFGAHSLSFGDGVTLQDGDVMGVRFDGFGRPLRNALRIESGTDRPVEASPLW
jgi:hypothetical protein